MEEERERGRQWRKWLTEFREQHAQLATRSKDFRRVHDALGPSLAAWELSLYVFEFWHAQFRDAMDDGLPTADVTEYYYAAMDAAADFSVVVDRLMRAFDLLRKHHPALHEVVNAYIWGEERQEDIAQRLGITQAAVSQRLKRALDLMTMLLEPNETKESKIIARLRDAGIEVVQTDEKVAFICGSLVKERLRGEATSPQAMNDRSLEQKEV